MRIQYLPVFVLACLVIAPALAEDAVVVRASVAPVMATSTTILGQPISYPDGPAKVTAAIVTLPPGAVTGWHEHEVPLFGYILEGRLTVDYDDKGIRVYEAGSGFMEAIDWPHNGENRTGAPVRILAVYAGTPGQPNATRVPAPE